ncbi:hypothetical protein P7H38_10765 [Lactococcus raffinolactis]|uniref:hypothetical protein n=1 Tax=Pseudolactococcus raffinolactis TaxID=1366 RepID=UPI00288CF56E|nr:hypothetical protein [Lactococcus raffinolactis]MDT2767148.1 hypothetical protein [Lactococcus raffinolactis]MDT2790279.1 hypothetical protein [Lactococcus raffinolactis]
MDETIVALNTAFAKSITEITVEKVTNKITQIKSNHDLKKQVTDYEQLVNDLLDNKNKLELTARNYKERLEQVTISDSDIESLHNTVSTVIKLVRPLSQSENENDEKSIDIVLDLLNSDTLKTLQLLGYNYKKAIGEPLTQITANFLKNKLDINIKGL